MEMKKHVFSSYYKKPPFFQRISNFIDKLLGIKPEDYLSGEEADYVMGDFGKVAVFKKRN